MTVKEYFEHKQPINAKTIGDTAFYQDISVITFEMNENSYASIKIAHVGEDLWSLGYEIKPFESHPVLCKDCTTHSITMGNINNFVYGMTQVILHKLKKLKHSKALETVIYDGVEEALAYRRKNLKPIGKITI